MTYDARCYGLACVFLEDDTLPQSVTTEAKKRALAQVIQTEIEDWITWEQDHVNDPFPQQLE